MPCLIAFSASVNSIIGGNDAAQLGRYVNRKRKACTHAQLLYPKIGSGHVGLSSQFGPTLAHFRQGRAQVGN